LGGLGIFKLSGRGMLVVSVAPQLGSGNSLRLLCCPLDERGREKAPWVREVDNAGDQRSCRERRPGRVIRRAPVRKDIGLTRA
jgi:hypothetical protein